jgi:diaminopimelate decarboxylase
MYIPSKEEVSKVTSEFGTPVFLTNKQIIQNNAHKLTEAFKDLNLKVFYAVKANYNPAIIKTIKEAGIYGIDAVSVNEIRHVLNLGFKPEEIIFTPSNPSTEEIKEVGELGVLQNLGSISELKRFGDLFPGVKVSIRICPKVGAGEFEQVTTGGESSKFGLSFADLSEVAKVCNDANVTVVGIHSHIGSGFYDAVAFKYSVEAVLDVAKKFGSIKHVNFGGGFGVQYHPDKEEINLQSFADAIKESILDFEAETSHQLELRIEPGKYLVSNSTVLLAEVTTVKQKGDITFVGVNTGFNHLIRPAMYEAYHHVVNCSDPHGKKKLVQVVGYVCETCDVFNQGIELADPKEGDVLAILVAGGYGASMSSQYNMRGRAAEVMIDNGETKLTRKAETLQDVTSQFVD